MLTAAAPAGAGGTSAVITDGGDGDGTRHASIRLAGNRVVKAAT
jgi:hypothetical protein